MPNQTRYKEMDVHRGVSITWRDYNAKHRHLRGRLDQTPISGLSDRLSLLIIILSTLLKRLRCPDAFNNSKYSLVRKLFCGKLTINSKLHGSKHLFFIDDHSAFEKLRKNEDGCRPKGV